MFMLNRRPSLFGLIASAAVAGFTLNAAQVDACKFIDGGSVNNAATGWFGTPIKLEVISTPGPRAGTCGFATENPKHIDISIFYAPRANASMYGFNQPIPRDTVAMSHLGNAALFQQSSNPSDRYKSENLAVLKGSAVLVFDVTLDKGLPFVPKEKLADFVSKLVPKM